MKEALVSAIIPTKNRSRLLRRAVQSVMAQSWKNLELVIVDDSSDDDTPSVIEEMKEHFPIRYIRNESSKGAAQSRNIAIENAKGAFIAGLDDDDIWHPRRIEALIKAYRKELSAVCSWDVMKTDETERVWKKPQQITHNDLLYYNRVGNQALVRKKYLIEVGGYDAGLPSAQDYDLWLRLSEKYGPVRVVQKALQTVDMSGERDRISNTGYEAKGYYQCFKKHKKNMNQSQRRYQLYRIRAASGKAVGWCELFKSVPPQLLKKEITRKLFL